MDPFVSRDEIDYKILEVLLLEPYKSSRQAKLMQEVILSSFGISCGSDALNSFIRTLHRCIAPRANGDFEVLRNLIKTSISSIKSELDLWSFISENELLMKKVCSCIFLGEAGGNLSTFQALINEHGVSLIWMIADDYSNENVLQLIVRNNNQAFCLFLDQQYCIEVINAASLVCKSINNSSSSRISAIIDAFDEENLTKIEGDSMLGCNNKNIFGDTYLHIAASQLNIKLLNVLINSNLGCDVNARNNAGKNFLQVLMQQFHRNCIFISRKYSSQRVNATYQLMFSELDRQFSTSFEYLRESEFQGFYNDFVSLFDSLSIVHVNSSKIDELVALILHGSPPKNVYEMRQRDGIKKACGRNRNDDHTGDMSHIDDDSALMTCIRTYKLPAISKIFSVLASIVNIKCLESSSINDEAIDVYSYVWNMKLMKAICATNKSTICDFVFGCIFKTAEAKKLCKFNDYRIKFIRELAEYCVDSHLDVALTSFTMTVLNLHSSCNIISFDSKSTYSYSFSELLEYLVERLLFIKWDSDVAPIVKMIKNLLVLFSSFTTVSNSPVFFELKPNISRFSNMMNSLKSRYYSRFGHTSYYKNIFLEDISLESSSVHEIAALSINNIDNIFALVALTGDIEIMRLILLHVSDVTRKSPLKFECKGNPITSSTFVINNMRCYSNPIVCCIFSSYFKNIRDRFASLTAVVTQLRSEAAALNQTILEYMLYHSDFKVLVNMPEVVSCDAWREYLNEFAGGGLPNKKLNANFDNSSGTSPFSDQTRRTRGNIVCISTFSAAIMCRECESTLRLLKKFSLGVEKILVTNPYSRFYFSFGKAAAAAVSEKNETSTYEQINYIFLKPKSTSDTYRIMDLCKEVYTISKSLEAYNFLELVIMMRSMKKTMYITKLLDNLFQYLKQVAAAISPKVFRRLSKLNSNGGSGRNGHGWVKHIGGAIHDIQVVLNVAQEARVFIADESSGTGSSNNNDFIILPLSILNSHLIEEKTKFSKESSINVPYFSPTKRSSSLSDDSHIKGSPCGPQRRDVLEKSGSAGSDDGNKSIKPCIYESKKINEIVSEVIKISSNSDVIFSEILAKVNRRKDNRIIIFLKKIIRYFKIMSELFSFELKGWEKMESVDSDIVKKDLSLWVKGENYRKNMSTVQIISADIIYRSEYFNNFNKSSSYNDSSLGDSYYWIDTGALEQAFSSDRSDRIDFDESSQPDGEQPNACLSPSLIYRDKFYWYNPTVAKLIMEKNSKNGPGLISDIERYEGNKDDFVLYLLDFSNDLKEDYFSKCERIESAKRIKGTFRLSLKLFEKLVLIADPDLLLSLLMKNIIHCDLWSIIQKSGYCNQECGKLLKGKIKSRLCFFENIQQNENSFFSSTLQNPSLGKDKTISLDRKIVVFADILKCVQKLSESSFSMPFRTENLNKSGQEADVDDFNMEDNDEDLISDYLDLKRQKNAQTSHNKPDSKSDVAYDFISDWAASSHCHNLLMLYIPHLDDEINGIDDLSVSNTSSDVSIRSDSSLRRLEVIDTLDNSRQDEDVCRDLSRHNEPNRRKFTGGGVYPITVYGGILPDTLSRILLGHGITNLQNLVKPKSNGFLDSSIYSAVLQSSRYNIRYLIQSSRINEILHENSVNLITNIVKDCENSDTIDSIIDLLTGAGVGSSAPNSNSNSNSEAATTPYKHCCGNIALGESCLLVEMSRNRVLNYCSSDRLKRMMTCSCCGNTSVTTSDLNIQHCKDIFDSWKTFLNSSASYYLKAKFSHAKIQFSDLKIRCSVSKLTFITYNGTNTDASAKKSSLSLLFPDEIRNCQFEHFLNVNDPLQNITLTSKEFKFCYTPVGDGLGTADSSDSGSLALISNFLLTSLRLVTDKREPVNQILLSISSQFEDAELFSYEILALILTCLDVRDEMSLLNFVVNVISNPLKRRGEIIAAMSQSEIGKSLLIKMVDDFLNSERSNLSGLWKLWVSHLRDYLLCQIAIFNGSSSDSSSAEDILSADKIIQTYTNTKLELECNSATNLCIERNINSFRRILEDHRIYSGGNKSRDQYFWDKFDQFSPNNVEIFNSSEFEIIKPLVCISDSEYLIARGHRLIPSKFLDVYESMFVKQKENGNFASYVSGSNMQDSIIAYMMFSIWLFVSDFSSNEALVNIIKNDFVRTLGGILNDYVDENRPFLLLCASIGSNTAQISNPQSINNDLIFDSLAKPYKAIMISIHVMTSILSALQFAVNKSAYQGFRSLYRINKTIASSSQSSLFKNMLLKSSAVKNIKLLNHYLDFMANDNKYSTNGNGHLEIKYSVYEKFEILNSLMLTYNVNVCLKFIRAFPLIPGGGDDSEKSDKLLVSGGQAEERGGFEQSSTSSAFPFMWNFYHTLVYNCKSWSEIDGKFFSVNILKELDVFCRWNNQDECSKDNHRNGFDSDQSKSHLSFKRTNHFKMLNFLIQSDNRFDILRSSIKTPFDQLLSLTDMLAICNCGSSNNTFANLSTSTRPSGPSTSSRGTSSSTRYVSGGSAVLTFMKLYPGEFVDSAAMPFVLVLPSVVTGPGADFASSSRAVDGGNGAVSRYTTFLFAHVFVSRKNMQFIELLRDTLTGLQELKARDSKLFTQRANKWFSILTSERPVYIQNNPSHHDSSIFSEMRSRMAGNNFRSSEVEEIFRLEAGGYAISDSRPSNTVILRQGLLLEAICTGDEHYFMQLLNVLNQFSEECGADFKIDGLLFYAAMFDMRNALETLLLMHKKRKLSIVSAFTSTPAHFDYVAADEREEEKKTEKSRFGLRQDVGRKVSSSGSSKTPLSSRQDPKMTRNFSNFYPFLHDISPLMISVLKSKVKIIELILLRMWKWKDSSEESKFFFQSLLEQLILGALLFEKDKIFEMLCKFVNGSSSFQNASVSADIFSAAKSFDALPIGSGGLDEGSKTYERAVRDPFLSSKTKLRGWSSTSTATDKTADMSGSILASMRSVLLQRLDPLSIYKYFISKKMVAGLAALIFISEEPSAHGLDGSLTDFPALEILEKSFQEADDFDHDLSILLTLSISIFKKKGSFPDFDNLMSPDSAIESLNREKKYILDRSLPPADAASSIAAKSPPLRDSKLFNNFTASTNKGDLQLSTMAADTENKEPPSSQTSVANKSNQEKPISKLKYKSVFNL